MNESLLGAIAIMTSGGDAPGMNACLRSVVRHALFHHLKVFAVFEGYEGLIANQIKPMAHESVSGILALGGTVIGTARSKEFKTEAGLLKAAENLVNAGIDKLVVIGGDGSLSGAEALRFQWPELLQKLADAGRITAEAVRHFPVLTIAGAVGSIDNDMAETDMTIGADSALHRIIDAVDAIVSTAYSHQRTFIIEVMGRNSGYLALMSAIATGATACFIPEAPPADSWPEVLANHIRTGKLAGRRVNIIIVAEGARDRANRPISALNIQEELETRAKIEARITILGHIQRGGAPSAFDRYMSAIFGAAAVDALLGKHTESQLVVMRHNRVGLTGLTAAVRKTRETAAAVAAGNYELAGELRGAEWQRMVRIYRTLTLNNAPAATPDSERAPRIGLVTAGRAAPGMNSVMRTALRIGMAHGAEIIGFEGGPAGMIANRAHELAWMEVELWNHFGGSQLGAGRIMPKSADLAKIAAAFRAWRLDGLLLSGDWSGYMLTDMLVKARKKYPEFRIPIVVVPASINNDLPESEYSIGTDTALNTIVEAVDKIKDSTDTFKRAYVVEVMGRNCGFLAAMSGLATGAEYIYTPETGITLDMLRHDVRELTAAFRNENRHTGLIIRSELADRIYSSDFVAALFEADGGDEFDVRKAILGPIQQGGKPTPYDRIEGVRFGYFGITKLMELIRESRAEAFFIGTAHGELHAHAWETLETAPTLYAPRREGRWWLPLLKLARNLAVHRATE